MDHRVLEHYGGDITRVNLHRAWRRHSRPLRSLGMVAAYQSATSGEANSDARKASQRHRLDQIPDDWCCPGYAVRGKVISKDRRVQLNERLQTVPLYPMRLEYDGALGWPEDGIAAGTRWDDIPDDWSCPVDCGAAKSVSRWWRWLAHSILSRP